MIAPRFVFANARLFSTRTKGELIEMFWNADLAKYYARSLFRFLIELLR